MDRLGTASRLHGGSDALAELRPALDSDVDFIHRDLRRIQMVDLVASGQQWGADHGYTFSHLLVSLAWNGYASVPCFG